MVIGGRFKWGGGTRSMNNMVTLILMAFVLTACRPEPDTSFYDDQEAFQFDAGANGMADPTPELPLTVDDWFGPSGYMGDGEDGLIEDTTCETRAPDALGNCHRFVWTPGEKAWAGVYWQFPDGNWGTATGLNIPTGATAVRFTAWGETGNEVVTFGTGMGDVDGFSVELSNVELTTSPTEYRLELTDVDYGRVVGGFVWTCTQAGEQVVFSIDNIQWVSASP